MLSSTSPCVVVRQEPLAEKAWLVVPVLFSVQPPERIGRPPTEVGVVWPMKARAALRRGGCAATVRAAAIDCREKSSLPPLPPTAPSDSAPSSPLRLLSVATAAVHVKAGEEEERDAQVVAAAPAGAARGGGAAEGIAVRENGVGRLYRLLVVEGESSGRRTS